MFNFSQHKSRNKYLFLLQNLTFEKSTLSYLPLTITLSDPYLIESKTKLPYRVSIFADNSFR